MLPTGWQETLHECLVYGMLFKAVAKDAETLDAIEMRISYKPLLEVVSQWAERKHHEYRREFERMGGKIHVK
ncbi:hypothetical protein [Brevibacillus sp. AF8]|uniref:hypothetical protein n=1 Tax=Brevibacillus sp. AF8 TaxID=2825881 RepID=UPI001E462274|nr:hypothetical protein [Brevibacillus sp. AF8]MCE0452731.1 hypothetical protein [Brevibacillus sp. AF8]